MNRLHLLDKASLFELLVRLWDPELLRVIETYPELRKIIETQHFQTEWKKYNVTTTSHWENDRQGKRQYIMQVDRNGALHGQYKVYDDKGVLRRECNYEQNVLHGNYYEYYSDPIFYPDKYIYKKCKYERGERHGLSVCQNDFDNVRYFEEYRNGLLHGKQIAFYPNGQRQSEYNYAGGTLHGRYIYWDGTTGKRTIEGLYIKGVVVIN
jgi:antitoxin component YwqK of YwqJK toxin-antitoxin module